MPIHLSIRHRFNPQHLIQVAAITFIAIGLFSCNGDGKGNGPTGMGAVMGVVHLPFDLTAEFEPVAGVDVRLEGDEFDSTVTSAADGSYFFDQVPNIEMTLSAEGGVCQDDPSASFTVAADDTITQNLAIGSDDPAKCLSLPFANASRMVFHAPSNTITLLYDAQNGRSPSVVTVNLFSGEGTVSEMTDLDLVYDLELLAGGLVAFNFKSSAGFGVRFFNPSLNTTSGNDVIFQTTTSGSQEPGKITADNLGQTVFVTHGHRQLATVIGAVYAISVSQRALIDADNDPGNGLAGFDLELVAGSLDWPHGIAYDPAAGEILVANRQSDHPFITAINRDAWGSFDRTDGLTAPYSEVRIIVPDEPVTGMRLDFLRFANGIGITGDQQTPMLRYLTGADVFAESHQNPEIDLRGTFEDFVLEIVPERSSWFAPVFPENLSRTDIEEWNLSPIGRKHRYPSTLFVFQPIARAFAVNAAGGKLYVSYENYPLLEIFDLCTPGECTAPGN